MQASNLQVQKWTGVQILLGGGFFASVFVVGVSLSSLGRSEPARSSVQASNLQVQKWTGVQILLGGGFFASVFVVGVSLLFFGPL